MGTFSWRPPSFVDFKNDLERDPKGAGHNLDLAIQTLFRQQQSSVRSGTTSDRPSQALQTGFSYYDTTLLKPIWWDGTAWRDATGTKV